MRTILIGLAGLLIGCLLGGTLLWGVLALLETVFHTDFADWIFSLAGFAAGVLIGPASAMFAIEKFE